MEKSELFSAIQSLEKSIALLDRWALLCAIVVAIGVLGEAIVGFMHWRLDVRMAPLRETEKRMHDSEVASLVKETELAKAGVEDAKSKIAEAKKKAAEADASAANANLKTEELRKQNLATEQAITPRAFVDLDKASSDLRIYAGTVTTIVSVDDEEAWRLAGRICFVLDSSNIRGAQWKVNQGMRRIPNLFVSDGVVVSTNWGNIDSEEGRATNRAAEALVNVLRANNITAQFIPEKSIPAGEVHVIIGHKPLKIGHLQGSILWK